MQARSPFQPRPSAVYRSGADLFKALAHPSRLLIIDALAHGEHCVAELTQLIGSDISTVSNHLSVLRHTGLIDDERRGQHVFYSLTTDCVTKAFGCMEEMRAARTSRG